MSAARKQKYVIHPTPTGLTPSRMQVPVLSGHDHSSMVGEAESDNARWHRTHCTCTDLCKAMTIRDAYDYNDSKKKEVSVGLNVRRRSFGDAHMKVPVLYPPKIHCDTCGVFIVDRSREQPFYFCWRCRRAGRSLQLCTCCYEAGVFETRERWATQRAQRPGTNGDDDALKLEEAEPVVSWGQVRSEGSVSDVSSLSIFSHGEASQRLSTQSTSPAYASLSVDVPSGRWTGEFEEKRSRRCASRDLTFLASGKVMGSGSEGCTLQGFFSAKRAGQYDVMWTESHAWGELTVRGEVSSVDPHDTYLRGDFAASDGGRGWLELNLS